MNTSDFPDLSRLENDKSLAKATFAGGCFWCMEPPFSNLKGVEAVISGYSGGDVECPTYEQVCSDTTGHVEAVQVYYHPDQVTYDDLLDAFWKAHDPTDAGGQFGDRGHHYKPIAFYRTDEEKKLTEASKKALGESGRFDKPIVTAIQKFKNFYPAETYHQNYSIKNPMRYELYKEGSGRASYLREKWAKQ